MKIKEKPFSYVHQFYKELVARFGNHYRKLKLKVTFYCTTIRLAIEKERWHNGWGYCYVTIGHVLKSWNQSFSKWLKERKEIDI